MPADDYLWDKSGDPDPEILALERDLARFAAPPPRLARRRRWFRYAAVAAALVHGIAGWRWLRPAPPSDWHLESGRALSIGERIATGPGEATLLNASRIGTVRLAPNSNLQIVRSTPGDDRLALNQGTLHAVIWAPAQTFAVETPAGTSIDLGCAYSLTVDHEGAGLVSVSVGWVAFQAGRDESFIPAGAACRTARRTGPSLPYFTDASPALTSAIAHWEKTQEVAGLLAAARPRDGLTIWHLLQRTHSPAGRHQVAQRFVELVPGVDAAALERGDPAAITTAWNALGLGTVEWWRHWKHPWAG